MQARRKAFRVETMDRVTGRAIAHANGHHAGHHDEIMSELRALRTLVKPAEQVTQQMIDAYKQQMGHVWLGFSEEHIRQLVSASGFGEVTVVALPPDAKAKGPGLFVATAQRR